MRAAVALGLQLALRSGRAARLRSALVAAAALVGTTVLLSVAGLARASSGRTTESGLGWVGVALVAGIGLPVMVLAATVGRLSAELRDRRLANLRLMGLSSGRARVVAVTETAGASIAGALAGLVLVETIRPLLAHVPVWGVTYPAGSIRPWPLTTAAIMLGVPLAVAAVSSLPQRLDLGSALARARRGDSRRPGLWRLIPLAVGLAWCGYFAAASDPGRGATWITVNLLGSVIALGLGTVLVLPVAVRLTGDLILLLGRGSASAIAARRIQAQPAGVTRVIAGLLIGLFLVAGARCVVVAFESTPQYQYAARNVTVEQRAMVTVRQKALTEVTRKLEDLDGVRGTVVAHRLNAGGECEGDGYCGDGAVVSCADLTRLAPSVGDCRTPLWVFDHPDHESVVDIVWRVSDGKGEIALPAPTRAIGDDAQAGLEPLTGSFSVLIPAGLPGLKGLVFDRADIVVLADPGRDLIDRLLASGLAEDGVSGFDSADYDFVRTLRAMVWTVAIVVLSLGLLSFGIAALDRALSRRREVVGLQLVGVPRGVLRRIQWIEAGVPITVGSLLAIALGTAAGATYLALDPDALGIPWTMVGSLSLIAAVGAVLVTSITVLASSPPLRADLIRQE